MKQINLMMLEVLKLLRIGMLINLHSMYYKKCPKKFYHSEELHVKNKVTKLLKLSFFESFHGQCC